MSKMGELKTCPKCKIDLSLTGVDEAGAWENWGFIVGEYKVYDEVKPLSKDSGNFKRMRPSTGPSSYLHKKVAVWRFGDKYQTANEYMKDANLWKVIQQTPIKQEHLKQEIMTLVKEFKKYSKNANINKWVAAATYHLNKTENLLIDKTDIFSSLKTKEKGFAKFYTKFRLKLNLPPSPAPLPEEHKEYILTTIPGVKGETTGVLENMPKHSLEQVSNNFPSSSSEMAVVASSEQGQVDKHRIETLIKLTKMYGSLVFSFILDIISSLKTSKVNSYTTEWALDMKEKVLKWLDYFDNTSPFLDPEKLK